MKRIVIVGVATLLAALLYEYRENKELKADRDRYKSNTEILLSDVEYYKSTGNLNAAKVGIIQLQLDEYLKYREEDARLIHDLKIKNKELSSVASAQLETIERLEGTVRDSIIYRDNLIVDTLRCVDIDTEWISLHCCASADSSFNGWINYKEKIKIVSETKYKRFLGFLWRTNKVKERKVNVISLNPNTKKIDFEFVELK